MKTFSLLEVEEITGAIAFYKLCENSCDENEISKSVCYYDEFEKQIKKEGNLSKELLTAQTRMIMIAQGHRLPLEKFRDITPKSKEEVVKEYEIKTKHFRIYLIEHTDSGKIIIMGGKKTTQKEDIQKFRLIKNRYLDSLNP